MGQMDGDDGGGAHQYHYQALMAAVHQPTLPFPLPLPAGPEAPPHNAAPQPPTPRGFADWSASTSAFSSLAAQSAPAASTNAVHYSISPCCAFWTHYMLNKNVYPSFPPPHDEQPHHLRLANNHPKDAGSATSFGVHSFTTASMAPNICTHMPPIQGPISVKEENNPEDLPRVVKRSDVLETRNSGVELHSDTVITLPDSKQGHENHATKFNSGEYQVILRKELTKSDVGNVGRIVLPKKDAEASLPPLLQRDPVILHMDDMVLPVTWTFKYRYWPNNKSRMYILDSAGEFLKTHGLQAGDVLIIYKNLAPGKFIIRGEKAIHQQTTNP